MVVSKGLKAYQTRVASQKRAHTMDAAVELFLADGYAQTSLEAVARKAGVSSATVYKHFPTKADLFGAIMSRLWENDPDAEAVVPEPGDPRTGLVRIGRDYARLLLDRQSVDLFRVIIAETTRFPELGQELYERGKKPYLDRLRVYLEAEIAAGTLAIDELPLAKRQFLGMINDVIFWPRLLIRDLEVSSEEAEDVIQGAVATFLARYAL